MRSTSFQPYQSEIFDLSSRHSSNPLFSLCPGSSHSTMLFASSKRGSELVVAEVVVLVVAAPACTAGTASTLALIKLTHDWVRDAFDLLLLFFELLRLSFRILIHPVERLVDGAGEFLFVLFREFVCKALLVVLERVLKVVKIALKAILRVDLLLHFLVLLGELFRLAHHALDVLFGEATLLCSDGNLLCFACTLVFSGYLKDTICINFKGHFDLRYASRSRRNA